ncbi:DcaP family trimeric outer membrane transporter [Coprobacter tertius]|uniref:DcaP family trimeric outer membrane transporter n=1 Tax=Coprobacter tertius TaxID=2944915 RepID=A0ABT1MHD7_9BACT|nr:DcaP family trimeric outer membrane transporter [Coprobacter tertius]MCP9611774.1 DcaP family trimeric outer membrane transporter [Coprobacter tertius]
MRKLLFFTVLLLTVINGYAQKKNFSYKFYGQIRTDLFYNSRANEETVDGLFYMYPKDKVYDSNGKDLNATANGSFYVLYSRLGLDLTGPALGKAKTSAKIEADFRGSGTSFSTVRLRHAYFNLDWGNSVLLIGQTWHPLFGEVSPQILNLSVGAPFQPFSRAPQIRYRFTNKKIQFTGAAIWQSQYLSVGLNNVKSQNYIKYSCVPEFYFGIDFKNKHWLAGVGIELLSLKYRTQSTVNNGIEKIFKVNERLTSASYEIHAKYTSEKWYIGAKSILGSNLTQTSMLGGFGITSIDNLTGKQEYTPLRNSSSWINIVYGSKWKPGIFAGYIKNLGARKPVFQVFGTGTDLDRLITAGAELTYNLPHWRFGLEYTYCSAAYGTLDKSNGKIINPRSVANHRIIGVALFLF